MELGLKKGTEQGCKAPSFGSGVGKDMTNRHRIKELNMLERVLY